MGTIIEFKDIYKSFGGKKVLECLNLSIEEGETITIIGGSGTGKSVLLKVLIGLLHSDNGKVFVMGQDVTDFSEREYVGIRKNFGMLFQGAALFDSITVKENVAYPLRQHFDHTEEEIDKIVMEKLEMVGLEEASSLYPSDLSGGMKKRVGLARAIAINPKIILYDEPTTGLDPTNVKRINALIVKLQKLLRVTSIVVTHDMTSAFAVSNRLAMLYNKKIAAVGTKEEMQNSKLEVVRDFIAGNIGEE